MIEEIHDGDRVRVLMVHHEFSKTQFASKMGMARTTLDRYLNNAHWTTDHLFRASQILGVNLFEPYMNVGRERKGVVLIGGKEGLKAYNLEEWPDFDPKDLKGLADKLKEQPINDNKN